MSIIDRLDAALQRVLDEGETPRAIHLDGEDYEAFAAETTRRYQEETGSTALLWPTAHGDVQLIGDALVETMEEASRIPVRRGTGVQYRRSAIYSATGRSFPVNLP